MHRLFHTASFRLGAFCTFIFALCFAVFLFFTYLTTSNVLEEQIRTRVRDELDAFVTEAITDGTQTVVTDINERLSRKAAIPAYYYVSDSKNKKIAGNLAAVDTKSTWQKFDIEQASDVAPHLDEDHQIWGQGETLPDGSFIFVGQDAFRVLAAQKAIISSFVWSGGLAVLLALAAGLAISFSFLRRIDDINTTSLAIIDGRLKERIPLRGTSDEIDKLSANLNRMFDSNDALVESLKDVSTNIAHDLRTPLSRLRHRLEEAQTSSKTMKEFRQHIATALEESEQLLKTFAALLRIAQVEAGTRKSAFARVDLSELFHRVANVYQAVAEDEGKTLTSSITEHVTCTGDAELLLLLLVNLVENAIRHTPNGTKIHMHLESNSKHTTAVISDSGPGIPEQLRAKVLERLYRLDQSRSTPGSGLGLALAAAIAGLHETSLKLSNNNPGLKVSFTLAVGTAR
jgi:signal transduction histidine kinase